MKKVSLLIVLLLGSIVSAFGQFDSAAVLGTVHDSSGSIITDAEVTLTNPENGISHTLRTNADGYYEFSAVKAGVYKLSAYKQGFAPAIVDSVTVTVGSRRRQDLSLQIGGKQESVTVTESAPLLATDSSERGAVVERRQIVGLPLNGREYSQLVLLTTGTRQSAVGTGSISTNREGSFNINGLRSTFNNYLLDGLDNNAYGTSNQGFSNQVVQPSPDSLTEFQVVTNNESAQYGRAAGATVNVAYRSGTNAFHGTAYEFIRNNVLNGIGYFQPAGGRKPQYNRNQFGFTLGGPIVKSRAFFFLDYEGFRQVRGFLSTSTIATSGLQQGILPDASSSVWPTSVPVNQRGVYNPLTGVFYAAGTQIPTSAMSPVAAKVLAGLPQPTNSAVSNNYQVLQRFTNNTDKYDAKFDYQISPRASAFVRLSQRKANLVDNPPIPLPSGGSGNGNTRVLNQQLASGITWTRGSNQLLELRFGVSRTQGGKFPLALTQASAQDLYGIPGLPTEAGITGGLPTELISGYSDLGRQATNPQWQYPTVFDPKVNYSLTLGRHSIKLGYEYQHIGIQVMDVNPLYGRDAYNGGFSRYPTGTRGALAAIPTASIYNFADFLFGARAQYALSTFFLADLRQNMHFAYVQDDFKLTDRLTLNLGVRYEYGSPFSEAKKRMTNFDPVGLKMVQATDSDKYLIDPDRNNFAPRIGFAYQATDKTVLRGGYGIAYIHYDRAGAANILAINGPQVINAVVNQTDPRAATFLTTDKGYPAGITDPSNFNPLTANITYIPRDYRSSYVQNWHLSVQQQLGKNTMLDIGYVGNHAAKLLLFGNYNQAMPYTTGTLQSNRPIPTWSDITLAFNGGDSNYHSLQARIEHRAASGLTFLNSFTWSRAIDNGSGSLENPNGNFPAPQDIYNLGAERAESAYDQPITNTTSIVYELPFGRGRRFFSSMPTVANHFFGGWQISAINQAQTGQPLTVTYAPAATVVVSGIQQDFRGANNYRPNLVGTPVLPGGGPKNGLPYLDPAAFANPTGTPFGNAPRNLARGPSFTQLDFAANKNFNFTERVNLQFRAEFFNLLNHTNFLSPNTNFSSGASFGKITNTYDPRQIQFGLKLGF